MADKKISALTSATTPLAGTEVLPIVQSGATVKVSVDNLTTGKSVSASGLTLSGGTANGVAYLNATKAVTTGTSLVFDGTNLGVGVAVPLQKLHVATAGNNYIVSHNSAGSTSALLLGAESGQNTIYSWTTVGGATGRPLAIYAGATEHSRFETGGDYKLQNGNIVPATAAKGINFTANTGAAGMTSQLLNWYEEGTWTATLSDGTNNATMSAQTCRYVRIGRHIVVNGYVSITSRGSISGSLRVTGLPFTCANANSAYAGGPVTYASGLNITAGQSVTVLPEINTTYLALYVWAGTGGTSPMQNTQWTDSGAIMFSATYSV